jgi:hypothetical protein
MSWIKNHENDGAVMNSIASVKISGRRSPRPLGLFLAMCCLVSFAAAPQEVLAASSRNVIPFQGAVAVKPGQAPLDLNPYGAKFEIYTGAIGGALLFEDIQQITIRNGTFSVELGGSASALDPSLARDNEDLWLQVTLDLDRSGTYTPPETIVPRIHLAAAPVALYSSLAGRADRSASADTLLLPTLLSDSQQRTVSELTEEGAFVSGINLGIDGDPRRGGVYRDNVCIAWGVTSLEGDLVAGFGIEEVAWDGDLLGYEIELKKDVESGDGWEAYSVTATSIDFDIRPELALCEPIDDNQFRIFIFGLDVMFVLPGGGISVPRVQSAFMVTVFGQPN